ncbi:outer membrane protein [Bartonella schoenbuchensis]|uniref:Hemin binding protein n=1 Tax=Bartonella schoenbuchensis m07a TaxID=1094496 RepID=N6VEQ5_9HYPH|nr:outer membrane protein [Bartonella schoenbuchensis]ENN91741.1 hemin binding protein [Bartonella schoenbuchensis m07a]
MNTKCLISTSIITLFTASVAQAADIMVPRESRPVVSPPQASKQISPPVEMSPTPVISAPTFSWNGFYLGGQIGGFSGKTGISLYAKKGPSTREWTPVEKDTLPQLSGFMGGLYAGANVDLGNSLILGVDTDIVWSNKQDTKIVAKRKFEELELEEIEEVEEIEEGPNTESERRKLYEHASMPQGESVNHSPSQSPHASSVSSAVEHGHSSPERVKRSKRTVRSSDSSSSSQSSSQVESQTQQTQAHTQAQTSQSSSATQPTVQLHSPQVAHSHTLQQVASQRGSEGRPLVSGYPHSSRPALPARHIRETEEVDETAEVTKVYSSTLKQKWSGATRVRIGFAVDRIVPYIAGGVAYAQLQNIFSRSIEMEGHEISSSSLSDKKIMVGYTLGGGVDFAMADNVILRAEYRYSDFGKQKFAKDKLELDYQTNDFRVGVAYKF